MENTVLLILCLIVLVTLFGLLCYCNTESFSNSEITKIQIFAERNTGSNYLEKLLKLNFPKIEIVWTDGWKHWQNYKIFKDPNYKGDPNTLYLIIERDPYDWVRSMHRKPHHIQNPSSNISEFIRQENITLKNDLTSFAKDPNLIELRNRKNKGYQLLKNKVKNYHDLKYEDLVSDPESQIVLISKILNTNITFKPYKKIVNPHQGKSENKYVKPKFDELSKSDKQFIDDNLDWSLEKY
jgi:hypothetical protein